VHPVSALRGRWDPYGYGKAGMPRRAETRVIAWNGIHHSILPRWDAGVSAPGRRYADGSLRVLWKSWYLTPQRISRGGVRFVASTRDSPRFYAECVSQPFAGIRGAAPVPETRPSRTRGMPAHGTGHGMERGTTRSGIRIETRVCGRALSRACDSGAVRQSGQCRYQAAPRSRSARLGM
jgi:hypothetical protein